MIRNIPNKYTDEDLLKEIEEFQGKFDSLFLPWDYEKKGNKGYAFINFVHPLHFLLFHEKFDGKGWSLFDSRKICELKYARFTSIHEIVGNAINYKEKKPHFFFNPKNQVPIEIPMVTI